MPKVELHLHLEGSIRPRTALELYKKNNPANKSIDYAELKKFYRYENLTEFVNGMQRVSDNIRSLDDLSRVASELFDYLVKQNIRYVEFDCALQKYVDMGMPLLDLLDTLNSVVKKYEMLHDIQANLIFNIIRHHGADKAYSLLKQLVKLDHPLLVGIGLSGDESIGDHESFIPVFELALEANLHRTAHAGEYKGAESIWKVIQLLKAERIDHGTRAIEDSLLINFLTEKQIPLTQCLTSNVRLRVVRNYHEHPFYTMYKKGVCVTLNTDDPQVFDVTLGEEYLTALKTFNFSVEDIKKIVLNGVQASFLDNKKKEILYAKISNQINQLMDRVVKV